MNWNAAKDALYEWASSASGVSVIWARQSAPPPATPYVTLALVGGPIAIGHDAQRRVHLPDGEELADLRVDWLGAREMTLSVNVYGGDALAIASTLQSSLSLETVRDALAAAGMSVIRAGDIRDLTALLETTFESRAQMDVRLRFTTTTSELTTFIETVSFDVEPV